ncbi:hypothetical protein BIW11_07732 [Tropilaelaps mercedesae]|uniref:Serine/threonine-protein kinase greatwall n=1 Tax=Tropilaelaps mercedesae TaxID=418985 RepID=A0A1V9XSP0_9ACAR|nr:hypothetical protein BIW11_07732 [Tropilaelaps mercedesae]
MFISLYDLHELCMDRDMFVAHQCAQLIRQLSIYLSELCAHLSRLGNCEACDLLRVADWCVDRSAMAICENRPEPAVRCLPHIGDFVADRLLGAGAFGSVYKGRYIPANMVCTLKIVSTTCFGAVEHATADRVVASVIDHPFIVSYFCVFSVDEKCTITVMEYIKAVDLQKVVDRAQSLRVKQSRIIFAQLMAAVVHMHFCGLIHRDIKGSNALLAFSGRVKLIDFDTNKVCVGHFATRHILSYFRRTAVEINDMEIAGTPPYMAPEVHCRKAYGRAMDWWSLGVTLYKLMIGRVPFRGQTEVVLKNQICNEEVRFPKFKTTREHIVRPAINMISGLLKKRAVDRLGSSQYNDIINAPFLANMDWAWLHTADTLMRLPAFGEVMYEAAKGRDGRDYPDRLTDSFIMRLSPEASPDTKSKPLPRIQDLRDKKGGHQPLFTFMSAMFREVMRTGIPIQAASQAPLFKNIQRFAHSNVLDSSSTKSLENPLQAERLDIAVPKGRNHKVGARVDATLSEDGRVYYVITKIPTNDPTVHSGLAEGDVVLAINGISTIDASRSDIETLLAAPGMDEVVVSVLSSATMRLCSSRIDLRQVFAHSKPAEVIIPSGMGNDMITVRVGAYYDPSLRGFVKINVVLFVNCKLGCNLYAGDVLLSLNGMPMTGVPVDEVGAKLNDAGQQRVLNILPMSCLRTERPLFDRLLRAYDAYYQSLYEDEGPELRSCVEKDQSDEDDM